MTDIDEIKHAINANWPAMPGAELSMRVLDFVVHLPVDQAQLLTVPMLARGVGLDRPDQDLFTAITILVSSRLELLQPRAMLIDDDDQEYELGAADLSIARSKGILAHPETGEAIPDFEQKLFPFFVPTERLSAMMQSEHGT